MTRRPERIQMRRAKGWRKPDGAIYVGRPTRWGNPYQAGVGELNLNAATKAVAVGYYGTLTDWGSLWIGEITIPGGPNAEQVVTCYRLDLVGSLDDQDPYYDELRAALASLAGHDLCCWCRLSLPCHADVLLELANR